MCDIEQGQILDFQIGGMQKITVYAIIFAYRYFCDFGLGVEIREGLISQIFLMFSLL